MTKQQRQSYLLWKKRLTPWFHRFFDIRVEGEGNLPEKGGGLIVSNHRSFIDPFFVALCCPRPINFLAASFSFKLPIVRNTYRSWGALSLPLGGGKLAQKTLNQATRLLQRGELVGIFPEGVDSMLRRDLNHKVGRFHTGFARIAIESEAPMIPTSVTGLGEFVLIFLPPWLTNFFTGEKKLSQGVYIYFYRKVVVRFGKPVYATPYYGKITKETIDRVSSKVRRIITKLYEGEDLKRFLYENRSFDVAKDLV